jgi:hypothetical protein
MSEESPKARVAGLTLEVADLGGRLGELGERVDALLDGFRDLPASFHWGDLDPDQWASRETGIREWVDQVLTPTHPHVASRLPGCWFDHPHPRALVTGNWLAWLAAYRVKSRKMTDPDDYLTRRLPALDAALKYEFGHGSERCEQHDRRV